MSAVAPSSADDRARAGRDVRRRRFSGDCRLSSRGTHRRPRSCGHDRRNRAEYRRASMQCGSNSMSQSSTAATAATDQASTGRGFPSWQVTTAPGFSRLRICSAAAIQDRTAPSTCPQNTGDVSVGRLPRVADRNLECRSIERLHGVLHLEADRVRISTDDVARKTRASRRRGLRQRRGAAVVGPAFIPCPSFLSFAQPAPAAAALAEVL